MHLLHAPSPPTRGALVSITSMSNMSAVAPRVSGWQSCSRGCNDEGGCCAANCYCGVSIGIILALVLPVLLGPTICALASRYAHTTQTNVKLRTPMLTTLAQLGMLVTIAGVTPAILFNLKQQRMFPKFLKVHRYFAILPLGLTLLQLALLPAKSNAQYVLALSMIYMAYAIFGAVHFGLLASRPPSLQVAASPSLWQYIWAIGHVILLVALSPAVLRGSTRGLLWRPTQELAMFRLHHLWRIWRICMVLTAALALAGLVMLYSGAPTVNRYDDRASTVHEQLHIWGFFVQGCLFSLLSPKWRVRFAIRAEARLRRARDACGHSTVAASAVARNKNPPSQDLLMDPCGLPTLLDLAASFVGNANDSPLVGWREDPPGVGARLEMDQAGGRSAEGGAPEGTSTHLNVRTPYYTPRQPRSGNASVIVAHERAAALLGEGGFSVVRIAKLEGVAVAVKIAKRSQSASLKAFLQEVNVMQRANFCHAHLCSLVGMCVVSGCPAIVLEYCSGGDLSNALGICRAGTKCTRPELATLSERLALAPQIASGLAHLHRNGVVHCDIKASNVLLRPNQRHALGHALLADFGLAYDVADQSVQPGTMRYAAPEVCVEAAPTATPFGPHDHTRCREIHPHSHCPCGSTTRRRTCHRTARTQRAADHPHPPATNAPPQ